MRNYQKLDHRHIRQIPLVNGSCRWVRSFQSASEFRRSARQWLTFTAVSVACEFENKFCGHCYRFPSGNWDNWLDTMDRADLRTRIAPSAAAIAANIKVIKCCICKVSRKCDRYQFDSKSIIISPYLWFLT